MAEWIKFQTLFPLAVYYPQLANPFVPLPCYTYPKILLTKYDKHLSSISEQCRWLRTVLGNHGVKVSVREAAIEIAIKRCKL